MTMTEPTLPGLDVNASRGRWRKTDPQTSVDAGKSMSGDVLGDQQAQVLAAVLELQRRDCRGANAWEVQCHILDHEPDCRIERNAIGSRFRELVDAGLLRWLQGHDRPGPSRRMQHVFVPTAAAYDWERP